jgi:hypothetical protein
MIDEQHLTAEAEQITPEHDLPSLIAKLDAIDEAIAEPLNSVNAIMDRLNEQSEADKIAYEVAIAEQIELLEHYPNAYEEILVTIVALQETNLTSEEELDKFATLRPLIEEAIALEKIAGPLANKEFRESRTELIKKTRWESVIAKNVTGEEYDDLRDMLSHCNARLGMTPLNFREARSFTKEFQEWQQRFFDQGDLLSEEKDWQLPEGWQPTVEIESVMRDWEQSNKSVYEYLSASRKAFFDAAMPSSKFVQLQDLRSGAYAGQDSQSEHVPQEIVYAFEKNVEMLMQEFDRKDAEYLQTSLHERPNMLFVGKQHLAREATDVDDVNAWVRQRIERHPDTLTRGLGFFNFEDGIEGKKDGQDDDKPPTIGLMGTSENTMWVDVLKGYLSEFTKEDPSLTDTVKRRRRLTIEDTIDHELTHYAHEQRLSIAWLRAWQAVTEAEKINVTQYIEYRDSRDPGHRHNASEDLAESSALYLNKPGKLLAIAPLRFAILNERDERYDTSLVTQMRLYGDKNGYTVGTLKSFDAMLADNAEQLVRRRTTPLTTTIVMDVV